MLRNLVSTALRSRTGTRGGYGRGYGAAPAAGGGRNALMSAGVGALASRFLRRR